MLCVHLQSAEPTLRNLPPQSMLCSWKLAFLQEVKQIKKLKTEVLILKCFVDFSSSLESVLRHWWIAGISCRKHLWVSWLTYHLPLTSLNLFLRGTWACTTFMPHIRAAVCAKCASLNTCCCCVHSVLQNCYLWNIDQKLNRKPREQYPGFWVFIWSPLPVE